MLKKILETDAQLSARMRSPIQQGFLRSLAIFFAHSGDSWFLVAGLSLFWIFSHDSAHTLSAQFIFAIVFQAVLVLVIKFTIRRSRPEGDWGTIYRSTDPHSFPSGHAARAAMLAVLAAQWVFPAAGILLALWALLVGLARVSLGVHYLVDVIGGWLIGIAIATFVLTITPLIIQLFPFLF